MRTAIAVHSSAPSNQGNCFIPSWAPIQNSLLGWKTADDSLPNIQDSPWILLLAASGTKGKPAASTPVPDTPRVVYQEPASETEISHFGAIVVLPYPSLQELPAILS
jgi:hypothetical protein